MNKRKFIATVVLVLGFLFIGNNMVNAWTEPSGPPPNNNRPKPINIGEAGIDQSIQFGGLSVAGRVTSSAFCLVTGNCLNDFSSFSSIWTTTTNGIYYNGGNVGIGTNNPSQKLEIAGTMRFTPQTGYGATENEGSIYYNSAERKFKCFQGTSWVDCVLWGGLSTGNIFNLNTGNIGIGTNNPTAKFEINLSTTTNSLFRPLFVQGPSGEAHTAAFVNNNGYGVAIGALDTRAYASVQSAKFNNGGGNSGSDLILNETGGNVGVGLTAPGVKFDVNYQARITTTTGNPELQLQYGIGNNHWGIYSHRNFGNSLIFWNVADRLTISTDGKVGIGTTSPAAPLHLYESSTADGASTRIRIENNGGSNFSAAAYSSANASSPNLANSSVLSTSRGNLLLMANNSSGILGFYTGGYTSGYEKMRLNASGTLAINTTTTNNLLKLAVNGKVGASEYCDLNGSNCITSSGLGGGGGYWVSSSPHIYSANSGNVGIGTVPSDINYKLDVRGGWLHVRNDGVGSLIKLDASATGSPYYEFAQNNEPKAQIQYMDIDDSVQIRNGGYPYQSKLGLAVNSIGQVGIGTSTPAHALHVYSTTSNAEIDIQSLADNGSHWGIYSSSTNNSLHFWGGDNYLTILRNGKIGMRNSSPSADFHLGSNVSISTSSPVSLSLGGTYSNSAATNLKLRLYDVGSSIYGLGISSGKLDYSVPSGASHVFYASSTLEILRINTSGLMVNTSSMPTGLKAVFNGKIGATEYCDQNGNNCKTISSLASTGGFWTSTTAGIYYNDLAGKIGIGTNNPDQKLTIAEDVPADRLQVSIYNSSTNSNENTRAQICVGVNGDGSSCFAKRVAFGGDSQPTLFWSDTGPFIFANAGLTKLMAITQAGRVGIGTTTPNKNLHIYSTSSNAEIDLQSVVGANNHWGMFVSSTNNSFNLWGVGNNRLTVLNDGKVGIGVDSPASMLDVAGDINISLGSKIKQNNSTIFFNSSTVIGLGLGALSVNTSGIHNTAVGNNAGNVVTNSTYMSFFGSNANQLAGTFTKGTAIGYGAKVGCSNCLVLGGVGADAVNVGIGSSTPTQALTVIGNIWSSAKGAFGGYAIDANKFLTTPSLYASSSEFKSVITSGMTEQGSGSINAQKLCINNVCKDNWTSGGSVFLTGWFNGSTTTIGGINYNLTNPIFIATSPMPVCYEYTEVWSRMTQCEIRIVDGVAKTYMTVEYCLGGLACTTPYYEVKKIFNGTKGEINISLSAGLREVHGRCYFDGQMYDDGDNGSSMGYRLVANLYESKSGSKCSGPNTVSWGWGDWLY